MTVAAVILAASPESALADTEGMPRVRRLVDCAWAGGAVPIVVVAPDPDGTVAAALAGAPVTLAAPAPFDGGPVAQIVRGIDVAAAEVRDTQAALVWPARYGWVDPETVTSLIEAHGSRRSVLLRPGFDGAVGWPALLPLDYLEQLRDLAPTRMPDELLADLVAQGVAQVVLDLGDPGTTHDGSTPRSSLPGYDGPPMPSSPSQEWGAAVADRPDDAPLEGPALAPFGPADEDVESR